MGDRTERWLLGLVLVVVVVHRGYHRDQAITENYVGRQVPTAMVARNLERGTGFISPELDTGPFPNRFLIEPPIYAQIAVWVRQVSGLPLEPSGRLMSAIGMAVAAWGLYGLARRRLGRRSALYSVVALAMFPITIRYGRAFQPDALMFGALLAGLRWVDVAEEMRGDRSRWFKLALGGSLIAGGLALKVIWAVVAIPVLWCLWGPRKFKSLIFALACLVPALAWYVYARSLVDRGTGSLAMAENFRIWSQVLVPSASFTAERLQLLARFVLLRSFTPIGITVGVIGLAALILQGSARRGRVPGEFVRGDEVTGAGGGFQPVGGLSVPGKLWGGGRLWMVWLASACLFLGIFREKLHHEYYLLVIAPPLAVGFGWALARLDVRGGASRWVSATCFGAFLAMSLVGSASTFRTPVEWRDLPAAARWIAEQTSREALVVAPEAVLYAADRQGCRLELSPRAAERAAGEWGGTLREGSQGQEESSTALRLVEFYRRQGASYLADLGRNAAPPERLALHEALRNRYDVLVDRPEVFIVRLIPPNAVGSVVSCPDPTNPSR